MAAYLSTSRQSPVVLVECRRIVPDDLRRLIESTCCSDLTTCTALPANAWLTLHAGEAWYAEASNCLPQFWRAVTHLTISVVSVHQMRAPAAARAGRHLKGNRFS